MQQWADWVKTILGDGTVYTLKPWTKCKGINWCHLELHYLPTCTGIGNIE